VSRYVRRKLSFAAEQRENWLALVGEQPNLGAGRAVSDDGAGADLQGVVPGHGENGDRSGGRLSRVLVVVDMQQDFYEAIDGAWEIVAPLAHRAQCADFVIVSRHVVDGEPDSPVHPEIMALADVVVTSLTGRGKLHSAFDGTLLAQVLGTYPDDFVLQVAGLAINGCVKLTALDAATIGYSVEVLVPCCRGSGSEEAKRELLAAGCALVNGKRVVRP